MQVLTTNNTIKMKILIFSVFFSLFCITAQSQEKERVEIMMKMLGLRNGLLKADSVSLSGLLADDVTYGHTSGLVQTKRELIHDLMAKVQVYKAVDPAEMNIRFFGNTAIVNMNSHVVVNYQGNVLDMNMRVVLVWIKQGGDWKLEARQSVKF